MTNFALNFVEILFNVLSLAVFVRVLLSWLPMAADNPIARIITDVTEPLLRPLRRVLPTFGMLDISPLVALILLQIVERVLVGALRGY